LIRLLPLTALNRLVLVLQLVQLEFEEVGEIVGVRALILLSPSALLLLLLQLDHPLVRFLGLQQYPEGSLLGLERGLRPQRVEHHPCGVHRGRSLRQHLGDHTELLVRP